MRDVNAKSKGMEMLNLILRIVNVKYELCKGYSDGHYDLTSIFITEFPLQNDPDSKLVRIHVINNS